MNISGIAQNREDSKAAGREVLVARYRAVRAASEALCRPLAVEDYGLQAMADASPPKWHLAHTSWFFETFLLVPFQSGYEPFHRLYDHLFNSYYETVGRPFPRTQRGLLSRPTVAQEPPRSTIWLAMNLPLYSPSEPASGLKPGYGA